MCKCNRFFRPGLLLALVGGGLPACGAQSSDDIRKTDEPSICGVNDMQHVELYNGALGPSVAFVAAHQAPVGNLKWKNDLAARYASPGTVEGVRWCTGTLVASNVMITAGHCFDMANAEDEAGWIVPRSADGVRISSVQAALEMVVDFNYQLALSTGTEKRGNLSRPA